MTSGVPHITVCVCTFRRPELLAALLHALTKQATDKPLTFDVVVVDNDAEQSAKAVVEHAAAASPALRVTYDVEPRRNIALARNRGVGRASGEFVAFIDDDEIPEPEWLRRLLTTLHEHRADGVLGPVIPTYERDVPSWVIRAGFYERPRHATGHRLQWRECRTGNVLLLRELLAGLSAPFDPAFRLGEDQDFFRRMIAAGRLFVWADNAVVHETVPPARWRRRFLVRRAARRGIFSRHLRRGSPWPLLESAVAAPAYLVALPVALIFGHATFMSCAFKCSYHWGRLFAFVTH